MVFRNSRMKLLFAGLIAFAIAVLHCACVERFVCETGIAMKKDGVPLTIMDASPIGLNHIQDLRVIPPDSRSVMY